MTLTRRSALAAASALALGLAGCGGSSDSTEDGAPAVASSGSKAELSLVAYSTPQVVYDELIPAFQKTEAGSGVGFKTSFGASGDQSRAVEGGQKADVVTFSIEPDMTRLQEAGLVADFQKVSTSVVSFIVRKGNPKSIKTWDDLVKPGVSIVTANPASSGAARWNALAAYGQAIQAGGTEAQATEYVTKWINNVATFTSSGRDTTTAFLGGTGDVAMLYENEAILARQNGEKIDYIIPETTLLIENPGAITVGSTPKAKEWLDYVLSKDGQLQFARTGFRPIVEGVTFDEVKGANDPKKPFPEIKNLLTVEKNFQSWDALSKKFFDEKEGIVTKLILASGKAK